MCTLSATRFLPCARLQVLAVTVLSLAERGDPVRYRTPNLLQKATVSCGTFAPSLRVGKQALHAKPHILQFKKNVVAPRITRTDVILIIHISNLSDQHVCAPRTRSKTGSGPPSGVSGGARTGIDNGTARVLRGARRTPLSISPIELTSVPSGSEPARRLGRSSTPFRLSKYHGCAEP